MVELQDLHLDVSGDMYDEYVEVLNKFLKEVDFSTGALLVGSFARGELTEESDIDLVILDERVDDHVEKRETKDGIEVHQIWISPKELRQELRQEQESNKRPFAQSIAEGRIIRGNKTLQEIHELAKRTLKAKIPTPSSAEVESTITFLEGQKDELPRLLEKGNKLGFYLRANHVVQNCLKYHFIAKNELWPSWKNLEDQLPEGKFKSLLRDFVNADSARQKLNYTCSLVDDTVERLHRLLWIRISS